MKTSFWKIISFVLLMIGATIIVFPFPKRMVEFYKDAGMTTEARYILSDLMTKTPDNPELLSLSAEIHHLNGESNKAVRDLELAVEKDPRNEELLVKLATYHEWNRDPMEALPVWEKIAIINPDNMMAQTKIIDYYRYYGFPKIEGEVVANLIKLEQKTPRIEMTLKEERVWDNPLVKKLTSELNNLAKMRVSNNQDLFFDNLITGTYIIRRQYMNEIRKKTKTDINDMNKIVTICFELFVKTGKIDMGYAFASNLDKTWNQELKNRLMYLDVMGWSEMNAEALAILKKIQQEYPRNHHVLYLIVKKSGEIDDVETAINAYEKLIAAEPGNADYKRQLASLYLDTKQSTKAYHIYRELAISTGKNRDYVTMMSIAAVNTEKKHIMIEAAELIGKLMPEDINMIKNQAEIYLAADRPERAYRILSHLVLVSGKNKEDVLKMLEVAGFTANKEIIREAIAKAFELRPDDSQISLKIAELYQGMGDEKDAINAYAYYLKLNPKDGNAQKQLAQLYLWTNQQTKAAELMLAIANASPGDKNALIEAAKYSEEAGLIEQAFKLYDKIYNNYPRDMSIQNDLIRLASWTNKWDYVAPLLGKISDSDPGNLKRALDAGNAFVEMEDLKKGIKYLERASDLKPDDAKLRKKLAKYYGWVGSMDKKIVELEYLDSVGQLDKEEKILLAQAYLDRNDGVKALKYLKHYQKEDILQRKGGLMLAMAFELSGKNESAIKIYKRLAKENMQDAAFLARLGNQALWINHEDIALSFFKSALKKDKNNLLALKRSAQIYAGQNNINMAIKLYAYYNRLNPDDYEAHFQLGELFFVNERKANAFKEYKRSLKLIRKLKLYANNNPSLKVVQSAMQ
ncbi:MAG: tetratricopeptide repeat protein [Candidatus Scalinduaceae bacterium]